MLVPPILLILLQRVNAEISVTKFSNFGASDFGNPSDVAEVYPIKSRTECAVRCSTGCTCDQFWFRKSGRCSYPRDARSQPSGVWLHFRTKGPILFLRRRDGSVDFDRPWADYKSGFGDMCGEFWLGLEQLHSLTTQHSYKVRIDIEDFAGNWYWAEYSTFSVGPEVDQYRLNAGGYDVTSTAGDCLTCPDTNKCHNSMKFSTYDRDNDRVVAENVLYRENRNMFYLLNIINFKYIMRFHCLYGDKVDLYYAQNVTFYIFTLLRREQIHHLVVMPRNRVVVSRPRDKPIHDNILSDGM